MPITPADIQQKTFSEAKRGYQPGEVDEFLEEVSRDIDAMLRKIADLKSRLTTAEAKNAELQGEIEKVRAEADKAVADANQRAAVAPAAPVVAAGKPNIYSATEEQLSAALIVAQQTADRIVSDAKTNAEQIRRDAENQARKVIRQALDEKQTELDEIERLKVSRENFRTEYLSLIKKFQEAASANFPLITTAPGGSESLINPAGVTTVQSSLNPYGAQITAAIDDLD